MRYQEAEEIIEWLDDNYEYDYEFEAEGWDDALVAYQEAMDEQLRIDAEIDAREEYSYFIFKSFNDFNEKFTLEFFELKKHFEHVHKIGPSEMLCKMVFAHAVTLLEVYLEDLTKKLIVSNNYFLGNTLKNVSPFSNSTFKISEYFLEEDGIKKFVLKELSEHLYHNIPKTKNILFGIIGHSLDININPICKITSDRHDIVHRNGKNKKGELIPINFERVQEALYEIDRFVNTLQVEVEHITLEHSLL